uniref:Nipped-B protein n=1 Tax=Syphacia muris TaxID=451379 RepID=A0A0N5AK59_9BILA
MNDPNQIQSIAGSGSAGQLSAPQQALYNQQMFIPQQYVQMPTIYGGQHVFQQHQMDVQAFQQQHLLQAMQHQPQQQPPVMQEPSPQLFSRHNPQANLLQQQQYHQALQNAAVQQQQQQRQLEQQRLMEQQQRQLDRMHQEREAARIQQKHDELLRQKEEAARLQREQVARLQREEALRIQQEENQRRLAAQKEQRELQERALMEQQRLREEQKKMEEAVLIAEEAKKREEERRREMEKVMAIKEEQRRKQREAEEVQLAVSEKAQSFPAPIHLAGCHQLTKLVNYLPFPEPFLPHSNILKAYTEPNKDILLAQSDPYVVTELANAFASVNTYDIKTKHENDEDTEIDVENLPALLKAVYQMNPSVFLTSPPISLSSCPPQQMNENVLPEQNTVQMACFFNRSDKCETVYAVDSSSVTPSTSVKIEAEISSHGSVAENSNVIAGNNSANPLNSGASNLKVEEDEEQSQLRKQIVSFGKQPKAQQGRKKKDMVESLYDSLTGYFDPSEGRRRRQKTKTFEEEQHERMELEMVAQMELAEAQEKEKAARVGFENTEHRPDHAGTSHEEVEETVDDKPKFFVEGKKSRKRQQDEVPDQLDRPPTPSEIIQQREIEWRERQRKRKEKHKRRKNNSESEYWNNEVMAEKESYLRLASIIDQIFDNVENLDIKGTEDDDEDEIPQELLIEKQQLEELLGEVNPDRLVKLLTVLEKNIRDVVTVDGQQPLIPFFEEAFLEEWKKMELREILRQKSGDEDESDIAYQELIHDRILRALNAACTAMVIMTSPKMPKQVLIEDTIERSIQLCKQFLISIVYSASDVINKSPSKSKKFVFDWSSGFLTLFMDIVVHLDDRKRKKLLNYAKTHTYERIYARITELVDLFGELVC